MDNATKDFIGAFFAEIAVNASSVDHVQFIPNDDGSTEVWVSNGSERVYLTFPPHWQAPVPQQ